MTSLADAIAIVDGAMADGRIEPFVPAVAYALVKDGSVVHHRGIGDPAPTSTSVFRIASMSKSVTAATVLSLRDSGLLRLDDPVVSHLPWVATAGAPGGPDALTVRHLLTMSGGLPTDDPWGDRQEGLPIEDFDRLVAAGLTFCRRPGTGFEYSNLGYALLGRVVERVTGESFTEVARTRVLDGVGMASTTYRASDVPDHVVGFAPAGGELVPEPDVGPGAFSPMGGLWSTTDDIAAWIGAMLAAPSGTGPLSSVLADMQQPHRGAFVERISVAGVDRCRAHSYGYGLFVTDDVDLGRFIHHSGGYPGFGSHMRWHPATGWGVVALGNRTYARMVRPCDEALSAIVAADAAEAERLRSMDALWPQTRAAMDLVESLLRAWDDDVLDRHGAVNVDLDIPRGERRATWQEIAAAIGPATRDDSTIVSRGPAHARWQVRGPEGAAWLEVLLSPESPPLIQSLTVERS